VPITGREETSEVVADEMSQEVDSTDEEMHIKKEWVGRRARATVDDERVPRGAGEKPSHTDRQTEWY